MVTRVPSRRPPSASRAPDVQIPEPNTARSCHGDAVSSEHRIALQEYGESNTHLVDSLRAAGKNVTPVRTYGWELPEDTRPLREAARKLAAGEFDAVLLTTSTQLVHLMKIAAEEGIVDRVLAALRSVFIGSIGPTTSETLEEYGLRADFEPSHPRMGLLVNESADRAAAKVLASKR